MEWRVEGGVEAWQLESPMGPCPSSPLPSSLGFTPCSVSPTRAKSTYYNTGIFAINTQHLVHQARDNWRSRSYTAFHYQQEPFENAVQEHQRVAYERVEIAAAPASRAAAHMTSRFGDIENDVEANFSHQQRGSSSEITSESAQALEAQQHSLVQTATAEMMRRNAHSADVLSQ